MSKQYRIGGHAVQISTKYEVFRFNVSRILITYRNGWRWRRADYIMYRVRHLTEVGDCKDNVEHSSMVMVVLEVNVER